MKADNMSYVGILFGKICHQDMLLKCATAFGFIMTNFFFDSLQNKAMLAIFFLVIFDWITGVMAAKKSGEVIKSSKIIRTPIKLVIYFMLISGGRMAEYALPDAIRYLDETIIAFLALTELVSVLENTGKLGFAIPVKLLNKLQVLRDEE
jgi:toxin secretion/phage lysis holin